LVDAQLPALAERVRTMASEINRRPDWPEYLMIEIGRWWTVTRAWRSWDELDDATRGDLRAFVGWSQSREGVRAADSVIDTWAVLGAYADDDGRLYRRRTWLRGGTTGEVVQILDFAVNGPLPVPQLAGSVLQAPLARYPGHPPRRALFAEEPISVGETTELGEPVDLAAAADRLAETMAANPLAVRTPVTIRAAVRPAVEPKDPHKINFVLDETGAAMPVTNTEAAWLLLAVTGGSPYPIFGEIGVDSFRPLTVAMADRMVAL
jgi:hypothetical protein